MDELERQKLIRKVEKAKECSKWDVIEKCSRRLAEFLLSHGRFEEALKSFQEVRHACELQGDQYGVANANRMIGEMYNELSQFDSSLEYVSKYLEYAKKMKDKVEEQRALATIGRTYFCWASELKNCNEKTKLESTLKQCRKAYMKSLYICENDLSHVGNKEKLEMKARLLFNLGLVAEVQEDLEISHNYILKAISICKLERLLEDLHRCYVAQSSVYLKQGNTQAAINALDEALDIAKLFPNTTEKTVVSLHLKAEIFFSMNNFVGAKNVLIKAYKLKTPILTDRKIIEKSLKQAIALTKFEEDLIALPLNDFSNRKVLYEKLGDGCCGLGNYKQAIQYYLKMLDCAEKIGDCGLKLLPCYVSLAQTYKDDKQYDLSLEFCKKELEISKSNPAEASKTHLTIAEILDLKDEPFVDIREEIIKAKILAVETDDVNLQVSALAFLVNVCKKKGMIEIEEETKKELENIKKLYNIQSDEESNDDDETPDIAKNINLENVLSDSDQEKEEYDRPRIRNQRVSYKIKRNEKGETQLHVAIIKGDLARAKRLIEQGHPVKEQDLNGWTPLHEACNHGHVEIVGELLRNGADINDPGGKGCDGVTPLHDAASCGHFNVIELLLEKGASVTVQTKSGETPLDCLQEWRKRVVLREVDQIKYKTTVQHLKNLLDAAGFIKSIKSVKSNSALISESQPNTKHVVKKRDVNLRRMNINESLEHWREISPERAIVDQQECEQANEEVNKHSINTKIVIDASAEYKHAIDSIRKRKEPVSLQNNLIKHHNALLAEEDYVDDWLEDDLGVFQQPQKKRKMLDLVEHSNIRSKPAPNKFNSIQVHAQNERNGNLDASEYDEAVAVAVEETLRIDAVAAKPKHQTTLLAMGVERERIEPTDNQEVRHAENIQSLSQIEHLRLHSKIAKVKVKIDEKIFLIPILEETMNMNVKWLCEEAARRYCQLEGNEPVIQLKTKDGAILSPTDPISIIYNEELEGSIQGWKVTSIVDRYKDNCLNIPKPDHTVFYNYQVTYKPDFHICSVLEIFRATQNLNLGYLALTPSYLSPVFKSLKQENIIKILNLSGNVLGDEGIEMLCEMLEKLQVVEEVNLSCNYIGTRGVNQLSQTIVNKPLSFKNQFYSLDLSFNPIDDDSLPALRNIKNQCQLRTFCLDGCDFTLGVNEIV